MDSAKVENNNKNDDSGHDEVDYVVTKQEIGASKNSLRKGFLFNKGSGGNNNNNNSPPNSPTSTTKTSVYGDCELQTAVKSHISQLFHFPLKKKSESDGEKPTKPRLIKSSSIARLFGNTYNPSAKKSAADDQKPKIKKSQSVNEKYSSSSNRESEEEFVLRVSDLSASTTSLMADVGLMAEKPENKIRTITKGLGKLLRRNYSSVAISPPDPEYKVLYLGNVLTGWAKGKFSIIIFFLSHYDKLIATLISH